MFVIVIYWLSLIVKSLMAHTSSFKSENEATFRCRWEKRLKHCQHEFYTIRKKINKSSNKILLESIDFLGTRVNKRINTQHNKKKNSSVVTLTLSPSMFLFFWRRFSLALKIYFASSNWRNISCLQKFVVDLIMRINVEFKTLWLIYLKPLVSVPLCADMYAIDIHWHAKTTTCIVVITLHMEYYKAKIARIFTFLRTALEESTQITNYLNSSRTQFLL